MSNKKRIPWERVPVIFTFAGEEPKRYKNLRECSWDTGYAVTTLQNVANGSQATHKFKIKPDIATAEDLGLKSKWFGGINSASVYMAYENGKMVCKTNSYCYLAKLLLASDSMIFSCSKKGLEIPGTHITIKRVSFAEDFSVEFDDIFMP